MERIKAFIKKEVVLCIAAVLAAASMFFIPPDKEYPGYIDFRTLCLLFSLMTVVAGFRDAGTFSALSHTLLRRVHSARGVVLCLTLICFFSSMLITNDVALLTFVPLSVLLLNSAGLKRLTVLTVTLQTVAAPQRNTRTELICTALFVLSLLSVLRIVEAWAAALITALIMLIYKKQLLKRVDYCLLLTFVCFFVFIGNMGRIEPIRVFLSTFITGREMLTGALLSQIISNVPAAVLLSAFSENWEQLLIGVNIGGLGTLIASLASLISYKLYAASEDTQPKRFMLVFTGVNVLFFILLTALWVILK